MAVSISGLRNFEPAKSFAWQEIRMSRVAAIFDVDQTLVHGYTERLFFRYLLRPGCLSVPRA